MTQEELAQELINRTEYGVQTWYAIHQTADDLEEEADNIVLIYDDGTDTAYDHVDIH